ncbi:hypothetical protein C2S51_009004 [Perilla frutescens var. frutescens]|nr:hypothetical protein C2S51_009004 [Perilla frutescens var. frutescens]
MENARIESILSALVSILAVSDLEIIAREVLTYDIVSGFLPSLAVQLLLYMVDMSCVLCSTGLCSIDALLLALLLGSVAIMMVIVVAFFFMVMRLFGQNSWKIATALMERHLGATFNYVTLPAALVPS